MRFAFMGLGRASMLYHVPALKRLPGNDVVGGFDPDPERRRVFESATGAPTYDSVDELFARSSPDVAVVATPPVAHAELCLRAIDEGCHVYCEKPFVETAADADRVIRAAEANGKLISVNQQFREHPIFRAVREGVASGRYGRIVFAQLWQLVNEPPWEEPTPWRSGMAHRTLLEGGVHLVDMLVGIFGDSPTAVYARHSSGFHEDTEADAIQLVTLEFPGGRLGQITIDRLCPAATRYMEVRADCEQASLRASFGGRATVQVGAKRAEKTGVKVDFGLGGLAWAEQGVGRTTLARNPRDAAVVGTTRLLQGFLDAIAHGTEPPSSARESRNILALIEAAYESGRTGSRIELGAAAVPV